MPEKINIELTAAEADLFAQRYGNNPELLLGDKIRKPNRKGIGYIYATISLFAIIALGYLLSEERAKAEKFASLLEVAEAKKDAPVKLPSDDRAKMLLIALAKKSDINQQNILGQTILHQAIASGCGLSTFDFLIAQGADLNARAYGRNADGERDENILGLTPVMLAIFCGKQNAHNYEIALHLITRHSDKIDFTIETKEGLTLLMIACKRLEKEPDNDLLNSIVRAVNEREGNDI